VAGWSGPAGCSDATCCQYLRASMAGQCCTGSAQPNPALDRRGHDWDRSSQRQSTCVLSLAALAALTYLELSSSAVDHRWDERLDDVGSVSDPISLQLRSLVLTRGTTRGRGASCAGRKIWDSTTICHSRGNCVGDRGAIALRQFAESSPLSM
jgi:hypothetical protein